MSAAALAHWNDGPTKSAIIDFVGRVTTPGSSYVPLDDESGNYVATYTYDATRPICTTNTWGATP